jgi:poly-beta-hydroxyalkanoate depolymerase
MMRCSKYQYKEMLQTRNVSDWEKIYLIMNIDKDQREKMFELKLRAQASRKTYSKYVSPISHNLYYRIIKNLLFIKKQIFDELKKTNTLFDDMRNMLTDVQIAKFLLWVKSVSLPRYLTFYHRMECQMLTDISYGT